MLAKSQDEIPLGEGWRYEPKWDGFRAIVTRDGDVRMDSRTDRPLGRYFPELVELLAGQPPASYVMDGEILMVNGGVMDFELLQLRLHPAESRVRKLAGEIPATFVAFDLLELDGRDLRGLDTDRRRVELEELIKRLGAELAPDGPAGLHPGPALILTPRTDDPARAQAWFEDVDGVGQDGIVARRGDQPYVEGERVMVKVKHHRTADCVVGGYRKERNGDGVGSLLLGLYDDEGTLQYVGHTSAFKANERRELRETLKPLEGGSSFGMGRAPGGPSRWSGGRDTEWVTLEPKLVIEVRFERLQGGRFRHSASIVRWRPDRDPRSCTFDQLGVLPPRWGSPGDRG
jgi:ATP-dependent DNA ligase